MHGNNFLDFWGLILSKCYFIYLGEDSSEYPIIEMLKAQRIFSRLAIISDNLILDEGIEPLSTEEWDIAKFSQHKKYILIFADLKYPKYFFELKKICRILEKRKNKLIIILTNDVDLVKGDLLTQYYKFSSTHHVTRTLENTKNIPIQKELEKSLLNLQLEQETPTVGDLIDELDWQSFLLDKE